MIRASVHDFEPDSEPAAAYKLSWKVSAPSDQPDTYPRVDVADRLLHLFSDTDTANPSQFLHFYHGDLGSPFDLCESDATEPVQFM